MEGLSGVGPGVAMELLREFPGEDGLVRFREWWMKVGASLMFFFDACDIDLKMFLSLLKNKTKQLFRFNPGKIKKQITSPPSENVSYVILYFPFF